MKIVLSELMTNVGLSPLQQLSILTYARKSLSQAEAMDIKDVLRETQIVRVCCLVLEFETT